MDVKTSEILMVTFILYNSLSYIIFCSQQILYTEFVKLLKKKALVELE